MRRGAVGKLIAAAAAAYTRLEIAEGFTAEDYESDNVDLWPENHDSFRLFSRVSTQWNYGFAGPTGLNYLAVYPLLDKHAKNQDEWQRLLDDIRVMESAALDAIAKQNSKPT